MSSDNVVDIESRRARRKVRFPTVVFVDKVLPTGTKPPLVRADDDNAYVLKFINDIQGRETTINEVVASVIGDVVGAPVAPWSIVRVPDELRQIIQERIILPGFAFGSRVLETTGVDRMGSTIINVNKDGNINRIPQLIALWHLCNAQDIQVIFDTSDDSRVYSVDHGFWFGSYRRPWELGRKSGFPEIDEVPELREPIADECWDRAIESLDKLDDSVKAMAFDALPSDWGVGAEEVDSLVEFAISRKESAVSILRRHRLGR